MSLILIYQLHSYFRDILNSFLRGFDLEYVIRHYKKKLLQCIHISGIYFTLYCTVFMHIALLNNIKRRSK